MTKYKGNFVGTIGQGCLSGRGGPSKERQLLMQAIGKILPTDRGKQVYETSPGVYQVENNEQLNTRILSEIATLRKKSRQLCLDQVAFYNGVGQPDLSKGWQELANQLQKNGE